MDAGKAVNPTRFSVGVRWDSGRREDGEVLNEGMERNEWASVHWVWK